MEDKPELENPGLKWRRRVSGERVPYWLARTDAVAAGYPMKSANLRAHADNPLLLSQRCKRLQGEMLLWLSANGRGSRVFDGTVNALLDVYETHPDSTFRTLAASSRHPYSIYLGRIRASVGTRRITAITGIDVLRWHKVWREPDQPGGKEKLAAARMALTVFKSALTFGALCKLAGCKELRETVSLTRLPGPRPRKQAPTADQVAAACAAAHSIGRPSLALAYALQFETTLRQWDVIGRWVDISDPSPSSVLGHGRKWVGLSWTDIDDDKILTVTPHKTNKTSGATVIVDLSLCPMVLDELGRVPEERRHGPIVNDERTHLPYIARVFSDYWKRNIRAAAGLPNEVWNRDLRAGGITEGRRAGADRGDTSKLAGHSKPATTSITYDRDVLEATRRVGRVRIAGRNGQGT